MITVKPAALDLNLYAGDGFAIQMVFTDKDTGEPFPLPGTWAAQVRASPSASEVITSFNIGTDEATGGKLMLSLSGAQVDLIPSGAYWDLQQTDGDPRTWHAGRIYVTKDVTRP